MGLPDHDPVVADSVCPSTGEPLTAGGVVFTGATGGGEPTTLVEA